MTVFSFGLILFGLLGQGVALTPTATGSIDGVVRTAAGAPAVGVRVVAMERPGTGPGAVAATSAIGLAQTDERGRFRLENIPPGSYYIAAGRVALPTYFPGTLEMSKGTVIAIAPRAVFANIDFIMDDASIRPPDAALDLSLVAELTLPVQVRMEGSGRQPISADGRSVMIRLTRKQDGAIAEMPLNASALNFPIPRSLPGTEYQVTVENLPREYAVKAVMQDDVNLLSGTLKITARNFVQATVLVRDVEKVAYGVGAPMTPLEITLAGPAAGPAVDGVRVRGRVTTKGNWNLSLPGSRSILFANGSFECSGVKPGRHILVLQDETVSPSRVLAASIVVGDQDLDNVPVDEIPVLPVEFKFPAAMPAAGAIVPPARIRGLVVDDAGKEPVLGGSVTIAGKTRASFPIDSEGMFEIPGLLPGAYELTVEGSGHAAVTRSVVVGDEDVQLSVPVRR